MGFFIPLHCSHALSHNTIKGHDMWTLKKFKTFEAYASFIDNNKHRYEIEPVFINNVWAVEYKPLRRVY